MQAVIGQDDDARPAAPVGQRLAQGKAASDIPLAALVEALDQAIRRQDRLGSRLPPCDGGGS